MLVGVPKRFPLSGQCCVFAEDSQEKLLGLGFYSSCVPQAIAATDFKGLYLALRRIVAIVATDVDNELVATELSRRRVVEKPTNHTKSHRFLKPWVRLQGLPPVMVQ